METWANERDGWRMWASLTALSRVSRRTLVGAAADAVRWSLLPLPRGCYDRCMDVLDAIDQWVAGTGGLADVRRAAAAAMEVRLMSEHPVSASGLGATEYLADAAGYVEAGRDVAADYALEDALQYAHDVDERLPDTLARVLRGYWPTWDEVSR